MGKITTPEEMLQNTSEKIDKAIERFEKTLSCKPKNQFHYAVIIFGTCEPMICEGVKNAYTKAGWIDVNCYQQSPSKVLLTLKSPHLL